LVFTLVPVAAGAAVSSLEAPGADDVCAEAIAVAPTSEAATRTGSASLDRMKILLFGCNARFKTRNADLRSRSRSHFVAQKSGDCGDVLRTLLRSNIGPEIVVRTDY
jgi:hypothetical protein